MFGKQREEFTYHGHTEPEKVKTAPQWDARGRKDEKGSQPEKEASKAAREGGERRKKYDEKECQWDREWR